MVVGQSYEALAILKRVDSSMEMLTVTVEHSLQPGRPARPRDPFERLWYGRPLEIGTVPIVWYDSIDDPEMPEALRERLTRTQNPRPAQPAFQAEEPSQ